MKREIKELIKQMTLEEKAGLCSGEDFWHLKGNERLGIPSVMVADGPHGLRKQDDKADHLGLNDSVEAVCFPAACATAASFDEELLGELGDALGEECRAEKVSVVLGPALNMKRSPLCGRNFEYFSEDPYLAGKLAAAQVRGIQKWAVGACPKHFAANNQEYRRMSCSSDMDERTYREIYLAAFETVVKEAKPWTMMCSYNKINGEFASENHRLLTEILRDEWGFDGYVMSDWGAVNERIQGLKAGLDLEMPGSGGVNDKRIVEAVREGTLDEAVLDTAAERILEVIFRYADEERPEARFDREAHHKRAEQMAEKCAVLLENRGMLPMSREKKTAYIGGFAKTPRYQGGGSSHIHAHKVLGAYGLAGENVSFAQGFSADSDEYREEWLEEAVKMAAEAEQAVIFAGLPDSYESEGYDRTHMRLPKCQEDLIYRVAQVQKNTAVVLHVGSPVECPWAEEVAAILCMYLGGEGVGEAADALLYGDAVPGGHLPETWPLKLEDNPSFLYFPGDGKKVSYAEGVYMGYRYYDKKKMEVRWPFGHGLSYTQFAYGEICLSAEGFDRNGSLTVTVPVTNTGAFAGSEAVQLYVSDKTGKAERPEKELKGFQRVYLAPGETRKVEFTLNSRSLAFYEERMGDWYAPAGRYEILVGSSSRDLRQRTEISYTTDQQLPLFVDRNTTFGELMAHPATAGAMAELLGRMKGTISSGGSDEAISAEMTRNMVANAPLRAVQGFAHLPDEALDNLISRFNQLLGN